MLLNQMIKMNSEYLEKYKELLAKAGSLSKMFSDNQIPYLNYRLLENIYCYVFGAENISRKDNAIDAVLEMDGSKFGVGIKTFIAGQRWQKIAEMDALHEEIRRKHGIDQARCVSELRNKRITFAKAAYGFGKSIYHCVYRKKDEFVVCEEDMKEISLNNIVILSDDIKSLKFRDDAFNEEYNYIKAKSTLCKSFIYDDKKGHLVSVKIPVKIIEDPLEWLLNTPVPRAAGFLQQFQRPKAMYPYVCLPLYSPRCPDRKPAGKSGLNQWNAGGRERHEDEAYIPIPAWIHKNFPDFFPARDIDFELQLPNGNVVSAKVCQDNGKALMSNPNKVLGHWLLREVLRVEPDHLVTRKILDEVGVDTVIVWKTGELSYFMDFRPTGTYEDFKAGYLIEEE